MQKVFENTKVVLVNTTHPGNVGAVARAMKTMGLNHLVLVDTCEPLDLEAIARASGADDLLRNSLKVSSLDEALVDCQFVLGTSARERSLEWPLLSPDKAVEQLIPTAEVSKVAMVFGRERDGLSNQALQQCHRHVCIPTDERFKSLNLAQAVQILAYELRKQCLSRKAGLSHDENFQEPLLRHPDKGKFEGFLAHMESVMTEVDFLNPKQPKLLLQRLRRLFLRASLDEKEINILRGFLSAVQKKSLS